MVTLKGANVHALCVHHAYTVQPLPSSATKVAPETFLFGMSPDCYLYLSLSLALTTSLTLSPNPSPHFISIHGSPTQRHPEL